MNTPSPLRSEPFAVRAANGAVFVVRPFVRGQLRAAIALDAEQGELPAEPVARAARRAEQLAALIGPQVEMLAPRREWADTAPLLAALTPASEAQLLRMVLDRVGTPPQRATMPKPATRERRLRDFDADTIELALFLHRTPAEVECSLGFIESLSLLAGIYKKETERARFEAQLHGFKVS